MVSFPGLTPGVIERDLTVAPRGNALPDGRGSGTRDLTAAPRATLRFEGSAHRDGFHQADADEELLAVGIAVSNFAEYHAVAQTNLNKRSGTHESLGSQPHPIPRDVEDAAMRGGIGGRNGVEQLHFRRRIERNAWLLAALFASPGGSFRCAAEDRSLAFFAVPEMRFDAGNLVPGRLPEHKSLQDVVWQMHFFPPEPQGQFA